MALYAFDGTWNENKPGDTNDTNVFKFYESYEGEKYYREGVGTRWGWLGKIFGGLAGAGGKKRVKEAYKSLESFYAAGDRDIDIIGFSRGAALAMDFVNEIDRKGVNGRKDIEVRFVGVWDIVPSFGIPGNDINLGYHLDLPENVKKCFHAIAIDERRFTFKVKRLSAKVADAQAEGRLYEVWFRGVHSDVGGGNGNIGLSSIPLYWMYRRAEGCGLKIPTAEVEKRGGERNGDAGISKNLDPRENKPRIIRWNDTIHESVKFVSGSNNPPQGAERMSDDGKILEERFTA